MVNPIDLLRKYKTILRARQLQLAEKLLKVDVEQIDLDNAVKNAGKFAQLQAGVKAADDALGELGAGS